MKSPLGGNTFSPTLREPDGGESGKTSLLSLSSVGQWQAGDLSLIQNLSYGPRMD